ncbi:MAG: hypothetical protein SOX26_07200 [Phocaeicola sp.]|nr:hypothetical protein [Phocaeicola sp.]
MKVDKIVIHEVDDYNTLPEGELFMNCNGMNDLWEYRVIQHVSAHNMVHVYKVARVKSPTALSYA